MRSANFRKWFCLLATGAYMFQAAAGCPDANMLRGVASSSTQSLINGIIGLYVKAGINELFQV